MMRSDQVPGPSGLPGIGCALEFSRDPLGLLMRCSQRYGDLFRLPFLGRDWFVINHPDDIETLLVREAAHTHKDLYTRELSRLLGQGLLTSEGELWRRQRKLVAHAFTPARIAAYAGTMVSAASDAIAGWQPVFEAVGVLNELAAGIEMVLRLPPWLPTPANLLSALLVARDDEGAPRSISCRSGPRSRRAGALS
jgi:cytochrome P450